MTWTKEKPTAPGWYWYGEPGHDFEKDKECVQVWPDGSVVRPGCDQEDHTNSMHGLFAGPILEPVEPEDADQNLSPQDKLELARSNARYYAELARDLERELGAQHEDADGYPEG